MDWQLAFYVIVSLISAGIAIPLAYILWQRRAIPGSLPLSVLMLAVAQWALAASLEATAADLQAKIFWSKVAYLGTVSTPALFLIFALRYTQQDRWLTRRILVLLWIIPCITLGMALTNELHSWLWSDFTPIPNSNILIYHHGPWFWVFFVQTYLYVLIGTILLVGSALHSRHVYRHQAWALFISALYPWIGNILYLWGPDPLRGFDWTPLAFLFTGLTLTWSIYRLKLFDLTPIADSTLFDTLHDAMIVLDSNNRVVDINPAAQSIIGATARDAIGKHAGQIRKPWGELVERFRDKLEVQNEINIHTDGVMRWYDLQISPLKGRAGQPPGRLIVVRDITDRKQAETILIQQANQLQTVSEISVAVATTLEVQKLLQDVVDQTKSRFNLYHAQIYLLDEAKETLTLVVGAGRVGQKLISQGHSIPLQKEQSLNARAARTREGVIVNDVRTDPGFLPNPLLPDTRSEMAVPIIAGEQLLGVLDVQADAVNRFSQQDLVIKTTLAAQIAVALQNARTFAQLREHQEQLREAMQIAKMGSYELDLTSQTATLSDEFFALLGTTANTEGGYQMPAYVMAQKYLHPEDAPEIIADFEASLESPGIYFIEREYRCLQRNNQVLFLLNRAQILRDEQGHAFKVTGTIQDISEQVRTQAEITRLATVIEQASEAIIITDLDGNIVYANPYFKIATGYAVTEVLGQNPRLLKSGQHDTDFYRELWNTIQTGQTWQGTFVNKRKDGSLYYEAATIFPIKNSSGKITNYAAVKRDITAQTCAEEEIRAYARHQELLNDITRAAIEKTNLGEMLQILADHLAELINADGCYITLFDEETGQILPGAAYGPMQERYQHLRPEPGETTLTESVLQAGRPLAVDDVYNTPYLSPRIAAMFPENSVLGLPLIANNRKFGAALISFQQPHTFTPDEITICEQASRQIALALSKAWLLEAEREQRRLAETLHQIGQALTATIDFERQLDILLKQIDRVVPYDTANILEIKDGHIHFIRMRGYEKFGEEIREEVGRIRFELANIPYLCRLVETGQPVVIPDTQNDPAWINHYAAFNVRSWIGTPIIFEGQVIALLTLDKYEPNFYTSRHADILAMFASEAALAFENARLFESERQQWQRAEAQAADLRQSERFLLALNEITRAASEAKEFQDLLQTLADRFGELINADGSYITLWDEERHQVIPVAAYGPLREKYSNLRIEPSEPTITESVLKTGCSIVVENVFDSPYISPRIASMFPARSVLGLPLILDEQKLGAALIAFNQTHRFTDQEIAICEQAAQQLALAIAKAQALETAQRRAREAETLRQAGAAVAASLQQNETIDLILEQLNYVVPYDSASVQLHRGDELQIVGGRGFPDPSDVIGLCFPVTGENPSATIFETRKPIILEDAREDYAVFYQPPHNRIRGWMGVPLILQDRLIGIISLDSLQPGTFTADHARLAIAFADQVAIALENARLYQEALVSAEHSDILRRAVQEISAASLDPEEVYTVIHRATVELMPVDAFVISLYDEVGQQVRQVFMFDRDRRWPARNLPLDQCFAGYVIRHPRSILIDDYANFPQSEYKFARFGYPERTHSGLAVPMLLGDKIIGVLFAQSYKLNAYTEEHRKTLELLAAPAAVALENTNLYIEVRRLATTDPLTNLYNRRHFFSLAKLEFERSLRYKRPFSIIMLDIDHFKRINDTYGHAAGDQVLQIVASLCRETLRKVDLLGRYGGEEFVFLMPETHSSRAYQAAERLRSRIAETPFETELIPFNNGPLTITVSLGVSTLDVESFDKEIPDIGGVSSLEKLIDRADQALYKAKQAGRNCVSIWQINI